MEGTGEDSPYRTLLRIGAGHQREKRREFEMSWREEVEGSRSDGVDGSPCFVGWVMNGCGHRGTW